MKSKRQLQVSVAVLALLGLLLNGCAIGNQYTFRDENIGLPMAPAEKGMALSTGVSEQRPYILDGDKDPDFIGLQRGGFGNPFDVTTASGNAFVEDVQRVFNNMLQYGGYDVAFTTRLESLEDFIAANRDQGTTRGLFLEVRDWKTDVGMRVTLHYDLVLTVVDENGQVLATSSQQGLEAAGGASLGEEGNGETASRMLSTKLSYLFLDPEVQAALK